MDGGEVADDPDAADDHQAGGEMEINDADGDSSAPWPLLVVGGLGAVMAVVVFLRTRRRQDPPPVE